MRSNLVTSLVRGKNWDPPKPAEPGGSYGAGVKCLAPPTEDIGNLMKDLPKLFCISLKLIIIARFAALEIGSSRFKQNLVKMCVNSSRPNPTFFNLSLSTSLHYELIYSTLV